MTRPGIVKRTAAHAIRLATLLVVVGASLNATPAAADFSGPFERKCSGISVAGWGTPAQAVAQRAWFEFWRHHTSTTKTRGCGPRARQAVIYGAAAPSGGAVEVNPGNFGPSALQRFVGLDNAPDPAQRTAVEAAAGAHAPAKLAIAPAAQTALTVIVNFPRHCQLIAGDPDLAPFARFRVSNDRLFAAWSGDPALDSWGELLPGIRAIPGNSGHRTDDQCRSQEIVRVGPFADDVHAGWFLRFLRGVGAHHGHDYGWHWPGAASVFFARQTEVARTVAGTPGAIGYTDLAAARAAGFQKRATSSPSPGAYSYSDANHERGYRAWGRSYTFRENLFWIPLEVAAEYGPVGTGSFAEPTIDQISIRTGRKGANCRYAQYDAVPRTTTGRANPYGDWSQTSAILDPGGYPLCALTYIGLWDDPADVYGSGLFEQAKARTVKDYLTTTFYSGQNILFKYDYAPVPAAPGQDLRFAAQFAAARSGWHKP